MQHHNMKVQNEFGKFFQVIQLIYERKWIEVFPNLAVILKIYMILPGTSYKVEAQFSTLSIIKNKFQPTREKTELPLHSLYEKILQSYCLMQS